MKNNILLFPFVNLLAIFTLIALFFHLPGHVWLKDILGIKILTSQLIVLLLVFSSLSYLLAGKFILRHGDMLIIFLCVAYILWGISHELLSNDIKYGIQLMVLYHGGVSIVLATIINQQLFGERFFLLLYSIGLAFIIYVWLIFAFDYHSVYYNSILKNSLFTIPEIDKNTFGLILLFLFLIGLITLKNRSLSMIAQAAIVITLFTTGSRQTAIYFFFSLIYIYIYKIKYFFKFIINKRFFIYLIVFVSVILLSMNLEYTNTIYDRFLGESSVGAKESDTLRFEMILYSINLFLESPLLGVGITEKANMQEQVFGMSDHNYYSSILASKGIIGFVLLISIFIYIGFKLYSLKNNLFVRNKEQAFIFRVTKAGYWISMLSGLFAPLAYSVWIWLAWCLVFSKYSYFYAYTKK